MKVYEDLTKAQKEKLNTYLMMRNNSSSLFLTFILGGFMFYAIGLPLLMSTMWIAGFAMIFISMMLFLAIIIRQTTTNKYIYLAFNMEDSMEDMFEIKKTDIMNLKRRWIKPKEDK